MTYRHRPSSRQPSGLSLLELVVILAVLGILAAAAAPALLQRILDTRVDATRAEMRSLDEGMVGPGGSATSFGFAGDIGRLPQTFTELMERGSLPPYTTATVRNVGMGWKGPYINVGDSATDYLNDAFGRPYTGASTGQVRSAGADGIPGNSDDLVYPPSPAVITGTVTVSVKTIAGGKTISDPAGYDVRLYYANGGAEAFLTDGAGPFIFANLPMGLHALQVIRRSGGAVVSQETTVSSGGGQSTLVTLWF